MALCSKCARLGGWIHAFHNSEIIPIPTPCIWCVIFVSVVLLPFFCLLIFMFTSLFPLVNRYLCIAATSGPSNSYLSINPTLIEHCAGLSSHFSRSSCSSKETSALFSMASAASTMDNDSLTVSYVTVPNEEVANQISERLVTGEFAACVNILPGIKSVYKWKDKIEKDPELLLIIKSRQSRFSEMNSLIKSLHPYEVCEVISTPIIEGNPEYLRWLRDTVPAKKEH